MSDEAIIIQPEALEEKIRTKVPNCSYVKVIDLSDGCGSKFDITVVSSEFMGKAIIAQHRLVNKAIEEERKHIHAITVKTKTPESWIQENEPEES
jgi:stress-induced morphogen